MTYEGSYTDCIRPVLGRGGPRQTFDIKPICWSFPTLDHAFAEARKAVLVSPYRLREHCSASQRDGFMTNDPVTQSPANSSLALHLLSMALGVAQTAVCTAAQLGLADHVNDGPKSVAALAEATGTHLPTLTRLMDVLVYLGLFRQTAPGRLVANRCAAVGPPLRHVDRRGVVWPDVATSRA
jgi:hypothetical protein